MRGICQRICLIALAALPLVACGAGGGLSKNNLDTVSVTGAVETVQVDPTQNADANTVRNAVSAVNLDAPGGLPLPWANRDTGSSGVISTVSEHSKNGAVCRKFETSRESFEGVSLYTGNACLGADGQWFMQEFAAI